MTRMQREEGQAEADLKMKEALLHMRYMERGINWKTARDYARADMQQLARAQELTDLATRQARQKAAH